MAYSNHSDSSELYVMTEEEANRLLERESHMDVFKKVQDAQVNYGDKTKKVPQRMYLQPIGTIPNYEKLQYSAQYDSELVEQYIERALLYQDADQLIEKRKEFAVIEDDFGKTLERMLRNGNPPSFRNLKDACSKYEKGGIKVHDDKSKQTFKVFTEKGVEHDDARAYSFAIAFYTGKYSAPMSMAANIVSRQARHAELMASEKLGDVDSNAAMIMYYLIKGLSHIDYYWGVVYRYVKLGDKDLADYKAGEIVTWLQFSSSDKNERPASHFKERNTLLTIYSLTGRSIRYFSNCADKEDEVLFLPHSSFLVCRTEYDEQIKKHRIYLRQIELGLCKNVVMWIDDNIFNEKWENKKHMEKASTLGTHANVHFIPKSNTEFALAFLRSPFGQRLKVNDTFRIVTDMKRTNESSPSNAGARLIYEVRKLGFNQECMVFTGNENAAKEKFDKLFGRQKPTGYNVTAHQAELENFVLFKRV